MRFNPLRKGSLTALALVAGLTFSSCIGPFNTWHQVLNWNRSAFKNKWPAEGVFIGFVIIPVYSIAFLADAVIFNSIEFWGGKNPVPPAPYDNEGTLDDSSSATETEPETIEATVVEEN